jgi:molybdopterin/thiamine biosynthesis adenylyltransferase
VIDEAKRALEESLAGNAQAEIAKEYPRYWDGQRFYIVGDLPKGPVEGCIGKTQIFVKKSTVIFEPKDQKTSMISARLRDVFWVHKDDLVLAVGDVIQPKTVHELDQWWSGNRLGQQLSVSKLHGLLLSDKIVVVSAPNAILGVRIDDTGPFGKLKSKSREKFMREYLNTSGSQIPIIGYVGIDASLPYITSRNLGEDVSPLANKKIALLGCGTIGSHLAKLLVQNGAGQNGSMTIVDDDFLSPGNLGRHLLHFKDIGRSKSEALAEEIAKFHPNLSVVPLHDTAQNVWHRIKSSDLIIDATGIENVSEFLNLKAIDRRSEGKSCSLLHIFLWHNGIAAQSFLNASIGEACYRCLMPDNNWRYDPRKNSSEKPRIISNRCGDGPYLPFSVAASVIAAALGLEAVLGFFGPQTEATLRTRVIDPKLARQIKDTRPSRSDRCPLCSK